MAAHTQSYKLQEHGGKFYVWIENSFCHGSHSTQEEAEKFIELLKQREEVNDKIDCILDNIEEDFLEITKE